MSLVKQLWLLIGFLIVSAFAASLVGSLLSAQAYYQEQLAVKNIDNANSLALTLSHTSKEPALLRSFLDAQFATGHYQAIRLTMPEDQAIELTGPERADQTPTWFRALFPLEVPAGRATVTDGWVNFGSLTVESDTTYARNSLWVTAKRLTYWIIFVAFLASLGGIWLVRRISQPLRGVVDQAEAIGDKRFVLLKEPSTDEFRRVVKAMNRLSQRVEDMLEKESKALAKMQEKALNDPITGVANREFFTSQLDGLIAESDEEARHTLVLVRIPNLLQLNTEHGRDRVNKSLRAFCLQLQETLRKNSTLFFNDLFLGRLNGSDFGIILTEFDDIQALNDKLFKVVSAPMAEQTNSGLFWSASVFRAGVTRSEILMKADHLLAQSEQARGHVTIDSHYDETIPFNSAQQWREAIVEAVAEQCVESIMHPLIRADGSIVHREAKVQLKLNGQWRAAGYFLPWSRRLGLMPEVDAAMLAHLLSAPKSMGTTPVVVHVSEQSLASEQARRLFLQSLRLTEPLPTEFHFEVPESVLNLDEQSLRSFIEEVRPYGCQVGISGMGQRIDSLPKLRELGLGYIKTDPAYAQQLMTDHGAHQYLQRMISVAHAIGLPVYLAGARSEAAVSAAWELGFDGATGPGVKVNR